MPQKQSTGSSVLGCAFLLFIVGSMVYGAFSSFGWHLMPDDWKWRYALQYELSDTDKVTMEKKPHNCEWGSAPIGDKHCHYDPFVRALNIGNEVVGGTGVKWRFEGNTRKISFDDGATWEPLNNVRGMKAETVLVTWNKVDE